MIITLDNITKRYGSFVANDSISLSVRSGEVHCLLGENGAGKTTLMNVIYGLSKADGGQISIDGKAVQFASPKDAIAAGIGMVHQHFMLIPAFSVTENVVLGLEPTLFGDRLDLDAARKRVRDISAQFGLEIDPDAPLEGMPVGIQQRVEIVKILYRAADIMIFDEPTAVLTPQEVIEFFKIIESLRAAGKAILFITHKLNEVMEIADRITVLRHGKVVGEADPATTSSGELANLMVGRPVSMLVSRTEAKAGDVVLALENVHVTDGTSKLALDGIDLVVKAGEIVGIAGVHGNGQTELIEVIAGLRPIVDGRICFAGGDIAGISPRERHRRGLAHVPEDRSIAGLAVTMSVAENMVLDSYYEPRFSRFGRIDWSSVRKAAAQLVSQFDVRTKSVDASAASLSGGNQQKVVIAREMSRPIKLMIAAQPTRGVDVGSIEYIHKRIVEARDEGVGVLLVSTELDEVLALSDRILVMFDGRILAEFDSRTADRSLIGLAMAGVVTQSQTHAPEIAP
ncbi:MAG: nucleoside transporter ATP-binding protein [Devosia sp.]|uniref:ABC transporter ATP-binding protein n=1 Tax=Devosia sp. TaxID=1871048 RepID=UPI00261E88B1|nr:ABC transporter ATP-binding protein [Devosia sp.]MDB5527143.1 nucleoside transporter ATP-binding protein [Devosia sp.]